MAPVPLTVPSSMPSRKRRPWHPRLIRCHRPKTSATRRAGAIAADSHEAAAVPTSHRSAARLPSAVRSRSAVACRRAALNRTEAGNTSRTRSIETKNNVRATAFLRNYLPLLPFWWTLKLMCEHFHVYVNAFMSTPLSDSDPTKSQADNLRPSCHTKAFSKGTQIHNYLKSSTGYI